MRWFRRKPKDSGVPPAGMTFRNPFEAVPLVAADVSIRGGDGADSNGLILRRELDPPRTRRGRVLRWFRIRRSAHVKLDRTGTFFWKQIDGQRDLGEIAAAVGREFKVPDEEARRAALSFSKDLMLRNFIMIRIAAPPDAIPLTRRCQDYSETMSKSELSPLNRKRL